MLVRNHLKTSTDAHASEFVKKEDGLLGCLGWLASCLSSIKKSIPNHNSSCAPVSIKIQLNLDLSNHPNLRFSASIYRLKNQKTKGRLVPCNASTSPRHHHKFNQPILKLMSFHHLIFPILPNPKSKILNQKSSINPSSLPWRLSVLAFQNSSNSASHSPSYPVFITLSNPIQRTHHPLVVPDLCRVRIDFRRLHIGMTQQLL